MTDAKKPHNSKCFSNILHIFVCTGTLPTHPSPPDGQIVQKSVQINSVSNPKKRIVSSHIEDSVISDTSRVQVQVEVQVQASPGIVARLMGLDSMPCHETRKSTTYESLFRSKSLNSLHFRPDFDPTRATFHRRGRTSSASFYDQGRTFLDTIHENLESNGGEMKKCEMGREDSRQKKVNKSEKVATHKGNNECRKTRKNSGRDDKKRYQERYCRGNSTRRSNNLKRSNVDARGLGDTNSREKCVRRRKPLASSKTSSTKTPSLVSKDRDKKVSSPISSKMKVDRRLDLYARQSQSHVSTISPVSVLDHRLESNSPSREDTRKTVNSRRKSSPRIKLSNAMPAENSHTSLSKCVDASNNNASKHGLKKEETHVAEYFVEFWGKACALAEDRICEDSKLVTRNYELFKGHYVEALCEDLSQETLEKLLNELTCELVELPKIVIERFN